MGFNIIKEVLNNKGIKQTWLAENMGKSYNMVNSYVQNRRQPSVEDLFLIASLLNVEPVDLLSSNESVGNSADLKNANCAIFDVSKMLPTDELKKCKCYKCGRVLYDEFSRNWHDVINCDKHKKSVVNSTEFA